MIEGCEAKLKERGVCMRVYSLLTELVWVLGLPWSTASSNNLLHIQVCHYLGGICSSLKNSSSCVL